MQHIRALARRMKAYLGPVRSVVRHVRRYRSSISTVRRYSIAWYEGLYAELGGGLPDGRPDPLGGHASAESAGAVRVACPPDAMLSLLPHEEEMFGDVLNDGDFRLRDNPVLPGRKIVICGKRGACDGRMPYVCRIHPVHFAKGMIYFDEALCRFDAPAFLADQGEAVERVRRIVTDFELDKEQLGYRRVVKIAPATPPSAPESSR